MHAPLSRHGHGSNPAQHITGDWQPLSIRPPHRWSFLNGDWSQDDDGLITPPAVSTRSLLAFAVDHSYADLEVEFDFRWDSPIGGAGLIVRARDPSHYYLIHFPACGQVTRASHFWAAVSKVGDSGWVEILQMQMVHGVATEQAVWHQVRVVLRGNEIHLWVDGRPFPVVRDDTYKSVTVPPSGEGSVKSFGRPIDRVVIGRVDSAAWRAGG